MQAFDYHCSTEGIHVIDLHDMKSGMFDVEDITDILAQIHRDSYGKPAYILLNLEAHYNLPLREFVEELRHFYQSIGDNNFKIAVVVQPSMINVLEVVVKTLVAKDFIHYFTMTARAYLWLKLEVNRDAR